ncbi:MAG: hypothetical protein K0S37_3254 [Microbacterium sp.]|jgi:hypothetical protein|nr:hypothetical protein [Microbacterium sp.]
MTTVPLTDGPGRRRPAVLRGRSIVASGLAGVAVTIYTLLAGGFFAGGPSDGGNVEQTWACIGGLALTAAAVFLVYRPILDGVGRILGLVAGSTAATSPLIGFLLAGSA